MANTLTQPAVDTKAGVRLRAQRELLARGALLASLLLAIWLGIWPLLATPAALPVDAPAGAFSAGRALPDLAVVAPAPHPIGESDEERGGAQRLHDAVAELGQALDFIRLHAQLPI